MPIQKPILYSYRRCPYAMRARMALAYAGIDHEIREISLRDKPQSMLALSPKGTVPVLWIPKIQEKNSEQNTNKDSGQVIEQSLEIMQWALTQNDSEGWWASTPESLRADILRWIEINDGPFKKILDIYKYPERYPEMNQKESFERALEIQLLPMDRALQQHRYLIGDKISLVDVALFPFVRQFYMVDQEQFNQAQLKALQQWLEGFLDSALFQSVMLKYPVWKE
jgi:glutathione S-transferase